MNAWVAPGYTEVRDLGHGTAGRVALAWHDLTGTPVAVRYLSEMLREDEPFLQVFRRLIRTVAEINHPNVARVYEFVESSGGTAVITELVDGVSLRDLLAAGRIEPEAGLAVIKGSLTGLAAAHSRSAVHGGYEPGTVLVDTEGRGKLIDFGVSSCPHAPPTTRHDLDAVAKTLHECLVDSSAPAPIRALTATGEPPASPEAFITALDLAATVSFGPNWEQRGRDHLADRATHLAARPGDPDPHPRRRWLRRR
jgi:serine/threonine protein kinase